MRVNPILSALSRPLTLILPFILYIFERHGQDYTTEPKTTKEKMVRVTRFGLVTFRSRSERSAKLSYTLLKVVGIAGF